MSASTAPPPPGDTDLQNLYDEVWAGFADETPSSEKEAEKIYSGYDYGNEQEHGQTVVVRSSQDSSAQAAKVSSPTAGKGFRPLPRPPGASSSISPNPPLAMPTPDVYQHAQNSNNHSTPEHEHMRRPPPVRNGLPGLPSSVRPANHTPHTSKPDISNGYNGSVSSTDPATSLGRNQSVRPAGAGAPRFPGYKSAPAGSLFPEPSLSPALDEVYQVHRNDDGARYRNYANIPPPELPGAGLGLLNEFGLKDNLVSSPSAEAPFNNNGLNRNVSTASVTPSVNSSARSGMDRTNSITSSIVAGYTQSGVHEPHSNHAVTAARVDSFTSYQSKEPDSFQWTEAGPSARNPTEDYGVGPSDVNRHSEEEILRQAAMRSKGPLELHDDDEDEYWEEEDEDDNRFVNFSLLSHIAVQLRDKVPRGTHVKGSIPYPRAFTGKDIVSTIQSQIQRELLINHGVSTNDRRAALQVARSLQSQLFFYEVEWGTRVLQDGVEDVYMFFDDLDGGSDAIPEREELPTGVITMLTKCYSPSCGEGGDCFSFACPRRGQAALSLLSGQVEEQKEERKEWTETVEPTVLASLPPSEINRQNIIFKVIHKEEQYMQDLDTVENCFIKPLREAQPPVINPNHLEEFIDEVFGNILDLRECNRRLIEVMYVRQREQAPVIQRIGDIFLNSATEFRLAYPIYLGHLPLAEKRMKEELECNSDFRLFLEQCSRDSARAQETIKLDLKHFLNRPSEHLQKYPVTLEAILNETAQGNPDADYLKEAIEAIKNLQTVAQVRTFQTAMGKGATGKWEWHDIVSQDIQATLDKKEKKRQSIIFELIKGEMAYVKDLENIEFMYIRPLRTAEPPIIPRDRLNTFIQEVFHNFDELHAHHKRMVERFHEIQREEHPVIRSVTAAVYDAVLNFREAYMEYIPNYPIAAYRIDEEMANNLAFKSFVDSCVRHPDAHRLDMKNFIYRPIPRLLRYDLLLKGILEETPEGREDKTAIPEVLDLIKSLGKESEPGVTSAKQKVELWRYNSNLVFRPGEAIDMDLLNENRSLIFTGKLLRQPDTGFEWNGWSELFVLLFDNYLVMTKPRTKDGVVKYHVNRRPIPLDLLTLANFTDPPTQRGAGILRGLRGGEKHAGDAQVPANAGTPESAVDSRAVFPCTLHHNGRLGGLYTLYAESAQARAEWKEKLEETIGLRAVVQDANKVFEVETLSAETFLVPSVTSASTPSYNHDNQFTGKVTCSVPFNTPDGRGLVAIGCAEGVWIGYRHDSKSMRRVLHLKMVTQCAMLEDFAIFLVLADKSLFAYHLEALVPSAPQSAQNYSQTPQKLNGSKDVHFFSVGTLHGRTLVIYMKKKGVDSVFRVLEPVIERINDRTRAPAGLGSRLGFRAQRSEWFRVYRDFFLPCESFDLIFLKAKIAILCTKGFEIMDLTDFKSVTIPQRDDPKLEKLARRCESCRPLGMFRSTDDEFLLCYDEFGLYVDKHGDPSRSTGTIEWEGTAERVAIHHPYILLFDSRFIEVRHVETGRLAQIIKGNDVRCLWDGRGLNSNVAQTPAVDGQENMVQDARVHGVMNEPDPNAQPGRSRASAQHVFELIPTIPLYLPGSLASPTTPTYFQQSNSPPHSPQLRTSASWRS